MDNKAVYLVVSKFIHNQTRTTSERMIVELLQLVQNAIAKENKTEGIDSISSEEMDIQTAIGIVQNLGKAKQCDRCGASVAVLIQGYCKQCDSEK